MRKITLFNILAATAISLLSSCDGGNDRVTISGTIEEGQGSKLSLYHLSGNNPVLVDTLRLGSDGTFRFKPTVEQGGPDFFCLVCNGQTIPVISDTLHTPIVVTTSKERFATAYQVSDSLNGQLRNAVALGSDMRRSVLDLTNRARMGQMSSSVYNDSLQYVIGKYKEDVLGQYIYADPASPVSYYLLFETVSGVQIFNPLNAADNRAYGAVANLWLSVYPNSPRTAYLEQSTREGMALRLAQRRENERADSLIQQALVQSSTFLDLNLPGINDEPVALSSINGKGNVTLLDFTAFYVSESSVPHNEMLSRIYEKYKSQGLRIYQVCMDADLNFWKVSASHLPWTVVRDPQLLFDDNGLVAYSAAAQVYNVTQVPTTFVMGRDGSPLVRVEDDSRLDAEIAKAL